MTSLHGIPPEPAARTSAARAAKTGDPTLVASARADHAASKIAASIDRALDASGGRLKREHAAELAARLKAAGR